MERSGSYNIRWSGLVGELGVDGAKMGRVKLPSRLDAFSAREARDVQTRSSRGIS